MNFLIYLVFAETFLIKFPETYEHVGLLQK